jgi:hypothetical protein
MSFEEAPMRTVYLPLSTTQVLMPLQKEAKSRAFNSKESV